MTQREGVILTAFTGLNLCNDMDAVYKYYAELMGRPVYTHEIPELEEELKRRSLLDAQRIISQQGIDENEVRQAYNLLKFNCASHHRTCEGCQLYSPQSYYGEYKLPRDFCPADIKGIPCFWKDIEEAHNEPE